jgi:hypothetical protein
MQHLHRTITDDELNAFLDAGGQVVWIDRVTFADPDQQWDAVIDHPDYPEQVDHVLAFLTSVNPQALDEAMAKNARLSKSLGASALDALIALAGGSDERS